MIFGFDVAAFLGRPEDADGYSARGGFQGWTLTERLVLDNYRRKLA